MLWLICRVSVEDERRYTIRVQLLKYSHEHAVDLYKKILKQRWSLRASLFTKKSLEL